MARQQLSQKGVYLIATSGGPGSDVRDRASWPSTRVSGLSLFFSFFSFYFCFSWLPVDATSFEVREFHPLECQLVDSHSPSLNKYSSVRNPTIGADYSEILVVVLLQFFTDKFFASENELTLQLQRTRLSEPQRGELFSSLFVGLLCQLGLILPMYTKGQLFVYHHTQVLQCSC